jgi:hypothetical protein
MLNLVTCFKAFMLNYVKLNDLCDGKLTSECFLKIDQSEKIRVSGL